MEELANSRYFKFIFHQPEDCSYNILFLVKRYEIRVYNKPFLGLKEAKDAMLEAVVDYLECKETPLSDWRIIWSEDANFIEDLMKEWADLIIERELDKLPM